MDDQSIWTLLTMISGTWHAEYYVLSPFMKYKKGYVAGQMKPKSNSNQYAGVRSACKLREDDVNSTVAHLKRRHIRISLG